MAFSLRAVLGMDSTPLERGMNRARRSVSRSAKRMLASLAPIAGFVGFSTLGRNAVQMAADIENLSKISGEGAEEFQKYSFAAKTLGIQNEKLADIFKDTNDKLGDFLTTGAGPMADFFEKIAPKVGITAEAFRGLSGKDALQLYFDSLQKANLSQAEMTFFMEAIASDATALIPLLENGGEAFRKFGEEAENAGQIMDKETIRKLKIASDRIDATQRRLTILTGEVMVRSVPALSILGQGLGFVADIIGVTAAATVSYGKNLGRVIKASVQPAIATFKLLGNNIKALWQIKSGNFSEAKATIAESGKLAIQVAKDIANIPREMAGAVKDQTQSVKSAIEVMGQSVEQRNKSIVASLNEIKGASKDTAESIKSDFAGGITWSKPSTSGSGGANAPISGDGDDKRTADERAIRKFRLDALKAEVRGEEELAEALKNRVKLIERVQKIMSETNATREEALIIARRQIEAEIAAKDAASKSKTPAPEFGRELTMKEATDLSEGDRDAARALLVRSRLRAEQAGIDNKPADIRKDRSKANKNEIADPIVKATHEVRDEVMKLRTEEV